MTGFSFCAKCGYGTSSPTSWIIRPGIDDVCPHCEYLKKVKK